MSILQNSNAISAGGYDVNNSLRFRNSASASLTRTPSSAGNRRTFTWSDWVKRGIVNDGTSPHQFLLSAGTSTSFCAVDLYQNKIRVNFGNGTYLLVTNAVYRDPSAWYHIVLSVDTTQATDTNRVKLYINNVQQSFASGTYPTQNYDTAYNNTVAQRLAVNDASDYFDGYMAEVNWIDGQALTPSSFGETDTTTGVWKPKAYTGTYGTNGFYLKFSDIATTSGSNAGLGKDFSGNSNYWTTNNISVTAGTTYDAMKDVPTNTSATVANYAVLNPLQNNQTLTGANLDVSSTSVAYSKTFSTINVSSGKWYCEFTNLQALANLRCVMGISSNPNASLATGAYMGSQSYEWVFSLHDPAIANGGTVTTYGSTLTTNDILMMALDMDNGKIYWGKNGTWFGSSNPATSTNPAFTGLSGEMSIGVGRPTVTAGYNVNGSMNFGQRAFSYTPPTGYVALNTYNLPTPTILQGNKYMDATLYTQNGAASNVIVNAGQFKPDLVWIKNRDTAGTWNNLVDSVRGGSKTLYSNATNAEGTDNFINTFNSNGFTLNIGDSGTNNTAGRTQVAWNWQAGQGSTSSNTAGSITSTVSVNTTAGFSVVTYTGTGSTKTFGHGLGVTPAMFIVKSRSQTGENWVTWHKSFSNTAQGNMALNTTDAVSNSASVWGNTAPTSTLITVGNSAVNNNTSTYVCYAWAEIAGFSKFGSYTGNGSSDGPFIATNFAPKFVLIKSSSDAGTDWWLMDSARSPYNIRQNLLSPNTSSAENASVPFIDFLSNGFKIRTATAGWNNTNGSTYIYACFAENPFKNSLAR